MVYNGKPTKPWLRSDHILESLTQESLYDSYVNPPRGRSRLTPDTHLVCALAAVGSGTLPGRTRSYGTSGQPSSIGNQRPADDDVVNTYETMTANIRGTPIYKIICSKR